MLLDIETHRVFKENLLPLHQQPGTWRVGAIIRPEKPTTPYDAVH
jgi:hypothetical protein